MAIIAFLAWNASRQDGEDAPAAVAGSESQSTSETGAIESAQSPTPDTAIPPSFDIVRISPDGDAVIAGRAEPGAEVQILEGDTVIAEVTA
ncbi:MAG: peptidoglycan-binding protein, partial [Alphaproteobacteria bacterium]